MKKLITLSLILFIPLLASAQLNKNKPDAIKGVGIKEHLGDIVPQNIRLARANGDSVLLSDLLNQGKPVILNPGYYECPQLCSLIRMGILKSINKIDWAPGKDFDILTFSIDPKEHSDLARDEKQHMVSQLKDPENGDGWYFTTGKEEDIHKLTEAVGFGFKYNKKKGQYAHNAGIIFLSPKGKITRYLYGIDYKKLDMKNALYEAADGKIGTTVDRIILCCYQYDPDAGSYVPVAFNIMRVGGIATASILGVLLGMLWLKEKAFGSKKKKKKNSDDELS